MGKVDISFKVLGDRSPPTMVRLFGHLPDAEFESVRPIDKEVAVGPLAVDQAFLVLGRNGEKWIEHFESEMVVSRDDMSKVLRRAVALSYKEDLPVWTSVVLVSRPRLSTVI